MAEEEVNIKALRRLLEEPSTSVVDGSNVMTLSVALSRRTLRAVLDALERCSHAYATEHDAHTGALERLMHKEEAFSAFRRRLDALSDLGTAAERRFERTLPLDEVKELVREMRFFLGPEPSGTECPYCAGTGRMR